MSGSSKLLILGGVALAALAMLYGLHYALFVEHQTLDRMGGSLNDAFVAVASENPPQAHAALQTYGNTKYNYVRQVDAHSHWGGLAMLLIVFGVLVDRAGFAERTRLWLAIAMLLGSILFPLAVLLQTASHGGVFAPALAVLGSGLVILSLSTLAVGFARSS